MLEKYFACTSKERDFSEDEEQSLTDLTMHLFDIYNIQRMQNDHWQILTIHQFDIYNIKRRIHIIEGSRNTAFPSAPV